MKPTKYNWDNLEILHMKYWYQCSISTFQTEFFQPLSMYWYSTKKRVPWSNKFGKCYSRTVFLSLLLSQREGSWWGNGHKVTKQEMSSEVGLQTGGEVTRSVDCLSTELIWGTLGAEGFVTRWILKKHTWEISWAESLICHPSALRISLSEGGKVGSIQLKIISYFI